jgi:biopolymer transport protein ExbB
MSKKMSKLKEFFGSFKNLFAASVIPVALAVSIAIYILVMGNPSNFQGNNPANSPMPGNYFGVIYKGGFIVPVLMCLLLTVLTFSIERYLTLRKAAGRENVLNFVRQIKNLLNRNQIDDAIELCQGQKGSVANVVRSTLIKYQNVEPEKTMTKEQKMIAIQKEVEEATSLELPTLEQNLIILATISSISTLMGLLGTVLGMIRAFAALATAGAPDSVALATGISEALVNTAFGIATAAIAVIMYNYYTNKIDKMIYSIDEAGFTVVQTYAANH